MDLMIGWFMFSWLVLSCQLVSAWKRWLQPKRHGIPKKAIYLSSRGGQDFVLVPQITYPLETETSARKAVVIMDAFAPFHGQYFAARARDLYGAATISVVSDYLKGYFSAVRPEELPDIYPFTIPETEEGLETWLEHVKGMELVFLYCESDSGLADAERLGGKLGISHHDGFNEARRNKFKMNEVIAQKEIPSTKQRLCGSVDEAEAFYKEMQDKVGSEEETEAVILKPTRGVASEDVFYCNSLDSVRHAFETIHGSVVFGEAKSYNDVVLAQEFLKGQEFSVDIVSKGGKHKVAAMWKYDKRPANGARFVYYATRLYSGDKSSIIADYLNQVLDALNVCWGLTHAEVILTEHGPRLVEINCRQHNMDFIPIAMCCVGYNAFDVLLAALFDAQDLVPGAQNHLDWSWIPDMPDLQRSGAMVHLVNNQKGVLKGVNEAALTEIQNMESVLDLEVYGHFLEIGEQIEPTTNIKTDAGWVQLVNDDNEAFERDYQRIIELMPSLFQVGS